MRIIFLAFLFVWSFAQSPLLIQSKLFDLEQSLQRRHLEQIHYSSLSTWRAWGILHARVRQNFVGEGEDYLATLPQVGIDKEFSLLNSKVYLGLDLNAQITSAHQNGNVQNHGYALGGYGLWKWENELFASFSLKFAHFFEQIQSQKLSNAMWVFDFGVGKRFFLPYEYFLQTEFNFGTGVLFDTKLNLQPTQIMRPWVPFNFLGTLRAGKSLGKHLVQTSLKMSYEFGAGGELLTQGLSKVITPPQKFDMMLGITYNAFLFEGVSFYTYADFSALNLDISMGIGFRVDFGIPQNDLLKYPTLRLKRLPNTKVK